MSDAAAKSPRPVHRVLLVSHVSVFGGAERGFLDIARALRGTPFSPVAALPPDGLLDEHLVKQGVHRCHVPLRRLRRKLSPWVLLHQAIAVQRGAAELARVIRRERITLVHANSDTAHLYAGLAARRTRVPVLWHGRDMRPLAGLYPWLESTASRMIAVSRVKADHWTRIASRCPGPWRRRLKKKMILLHNAVDVREFFPGNTRARARQAWRIDADAPVAGMVAHMIPWKNHALFLDAARHVAQACPKAVFLVVGDDLPGSGTDGKAALARQCVELGLGDRVRFTGFQSDMPPLYEAMDVLVHPAVNEPFGRSVAEAMAMGVPVVAMNQGGPCDLVEHGVHGFLTSPDAALIAEHVLRLVKCPELRMRFGRAGLERIHREFSLDSYRDRLLAIYRSL